MAYRRSTAPSSTEMEAGDRDRPVTIEQRPVADTVDAAGGPVDGPWTVLYEPVWMAKEDISLDERFTANQPSALVDSLWAMPYRSDMDPELVDVAKLRRLVYRDRIYDIESASLIGRREGVELYTLARSA